MLERMHPSVPICLCMVYLLGLRLTVVFSKRFGYTTFREKPPLVAKTAVFAVLPCLPLFTPGVNRDHPLCAVVSKTTFRAIHPGLLHGPGCFFVFPRPQGFLRLFCANQKSGVRWCRVNDTFSPRTYFCFIQAITFHSSKHTIFIQMRHFRTPLHPTCYLSIAQLSL